MRPPFLSTPSLVLAALLLPALDAGAGVRRPVNADLGVPCDPMLRSVWTLAPSPLACQYRFRADGHLDALRVVLTLRDCFDAPIPACAVKATVAPTAGTLALCGCEPLEQVGETSASGVVDFTFRRLGGRGTAEARLTLLSFGLIGMPPLSFHFTSPDLSGSCEPGASTTVIDLALWAYGLTRYQLPSDYDCSGAVDVSDLGVWAGGLLVGCP